MANNKNKKRNKNNKNNTVSKSTSKFSRYEKIKDNYDDIDLSATQQQQLVFDDVDLDATINLDTSFMDGKNKEKNKKILEEVVNRDQKYYDNTRKKSHGFWNLLLVFCLCLVIVGLLYVLFTTDGDNKQTEAPKKDIIVKQTIDDNYLFIGDKITEDYDLLKYYEKKPVVNEGKAGNMTDDILNNMKNRIYQYNPSKIFLLIGINDIDKGKSSLEITDNIEKIIKLVKENRPYCKIYIESIYPVNKSDDEKVSDKVRDKDFDNEKIMEVNKSLEKLADKEDATYINLYDKLIDKNGNLKLEYTSNGLYISDDGYEKITEILTKYLKD